MSKRKVKSPCVDVCKIDKINGLCRGCLRSVPEIKVWKRLSKKEQKALLADLEGRRAGLEALLAAPVDHCP